LVAAVAGDLALAALDSRPRFGEIVALEATPRVRRRTFAARASCSLCGDDAKAPVIEEARYVRGACSA
jgi:hypothetical protein